MMARNQMVAVKIARHPNGVFGTPFHTVLFRWRDATVAREENRWRSRLMLAVVFGDKGRVAVMDAALLHQECIGPEDGSTGNTFRAEDFEWWLRREIAKYEEWGERSGRTDTGEIRDAS